MHAAMHCKTAFRPKHHYIEARTEKLYRRLSMRNGKQEQKKKKREREKHKTEQVCHQIGRRKPELHYSLVVSCIAFCKQFTINGHGKEVFVLLLSFVVSAPNCIHTGNRIECGSSVIGMFCNWQNRNRNVARE